MGRYVLAGLYAFFCALVATAAIACVTLLCVFNCPQWEIIFAGFFAFIVAVFWFLLMDKLI